MGPNSGPIVRFATKNVKTVLRNALILEDIYSQCHHMILVVSFLLWIESEVVSLGWRDA